jgi:nucleotide-binding universal stress UspA family protein
MVPLDGSDESATALEVAASVAQRFGASLLVLEIVPTGRASLGLATDVASGAMTDPHVFETDVEVREQIAEGYISAVADELSAQGLQVSYAVGTGSEGNGIVEAAHREGVDLIVMATHPRSGVGRLVHRSVTDHVIKHAHLPVLVVPPKEAERK